jgi:hypothetical protein
MRTVEARKLDEIKILETEFGVKAWSDPRTGELVARPMTREEALESDQSFSETFETDFTPKALKKLYSRNSRSA